MKNPSQVGAESRASLIQKLRQIQNWRTGSPWPDWMQDAVPHIADGGLSLGHLCGEAADALEEAAIAMVYRQWQDISTAPVEPWTPGLANYYTFRCLLQDSNGHVCEGWGYWVAARKGAAPILRWKSANDRQFFPVAWMPLPPASSEHARSKP